MILNDNKYTVSVSARGKCSSQSVEEYLKEYFSDHIGSIDSVFGFLEPCKMYGGRVYESPELSEKDVLWLKENSIGLRLPLTNMLTTNKDYEESLPFLDKYHEYGNSLILYRDDIAKRIRTDFPKYKLEASVIKNSSSIEAIEKALSIYDTVVPHPNYFIISSMPFWMKDNLRLFLNMGCAFKCPTRICYSSVSAINRGEGEYRCAMRENGYVNSALHSFNITELLDYGFTKFKLLRERSLSKTGW